jgi:8-amino-7-oxononanoate synthase
LLDEADADQLQVVVTESIFSMEGDAAKLRELVEMKREKNFALLLDEAHGSGVYGTGGAGYANECGVSGDVGVFVATLSKALGCAGGAICGSQVFIDAVANFGRAYVYSTSVPASAAAACAAAIDVMQREPQRQERVRAISLRVRQELQRAGFDLPPGDSPIIPIIVGDDARAIQLAEQVETEGMLVWPMRPPTVARGSSRVRITLSSEHTDLEVDRLCEVLIQLRREQNVALRREAKPLTSTDDAG